MELAHKLAREMDENTTVSVSRVYAPNEYSVWLSPRDRARYEGVEHEVIDELCAYLLEHARGEDLALASRPHIVFHTDEALHLGEFGIEARMTRTGGATGERARSRAPRDHAPAAPPRAPPPARRARGPASARPAAPAGFARPPSRGAGRGKHDDLLQLRARQRGRRGQPADAAAPRRCSWCRGGACSSLREARRSGAAATVTSCSTMRGFRAVTPSYAPRPRRRGRSRISAPPTGCV